MRLCDEAVCLLAPADFYAVGQFYDWFEPVGDEEVVHMLQESAVRRPPPPEPGSSEHHRQAERS